MPSEAEGRSDSTISGAPARLTIQFNAMSSTCWWYSDGSIRRINLLLLSLWFRAAFVCFTSPGCILPEGFKKVFRAGWEAGASLLASFLVTRLQVEPFYTWELGSLKVVLSRTVHCLDYLGFDNSQLILSGISLGNLPSMCPCLGLDFWTSCHHRNKLANVWNYQWLVLELFGTEVFPNRVMSLAFAWTGLLG